MFALCRTCCRKISNWCWERDINDIFTAICLLLISVVLGVFVLTCQSFVYGVSFSSIDYDLINNTLPHPLFLPTIPDYYTNSLRKKSVAIYGSKKTGKSTFGKVLAMRLYDTNKPVIYVNIQEKDTDPCIELGIAAGLYPKNLIIPFEFSSFITEWMDPPSYDTEHCRISPILRHIANAASKKGVMANVIIDPLERFEPSDIETICALARYKFGVIKFILISTSTSHEQTRGTKHCKDFDFIHSHFRDISKDETLSYLRSQCEIDEYSSCVMYEIVGGDLGYLHRLCNGETIDEIIHGEWTRHERDIWKNANELEFIAKKLLNGNTKTKEFTSTEIKTIENHEDYIYHDGEKYHFAKRIYFHLFNDIFGNKSFDTEYNRFKSKCQIKKQKHPNDVS